MNSITADSKGSCDITYTTTTKYTVQGSIKTSTDKVRYRASAEAMEYTSGPVDVYADLTMTVQIFSGRKEILITDGDPQRLKNQAANPLAGAGDAMLRLVEVRECSGSSTGIRRVQLDVKASARQRLGIASIGYDIESSSLNPRRVTITYFGKAVVSMDMQFQTYTVSTEPGGFTSPLSHIQDGRGRLLAAYAGYSVRDVRLRAQQGQRP
jgi:hypothetical protein